MGGGTGRQVSCIDVEARDGGSGCGHQWRLGDKLGERGEAWSGYFWEQKGDHMKAMQ